MKRTLSLVFVSALLLPLAVRAQSTTPAPLQPAQQPAKPHDPFEDDPVFKSLPPERQQWVRKVMQNINQALDAKPGTPAPAIPPMLPVSPAQPKRAPNVPPSTAQPGCTAGPVKSPKFHIPKAIQDAINKQAKQASKQTGVDLDPNAPAQAVKDAQKNIPCPPATPAPGQPAANK